MKKIIALVLAAVMVFALCACGKAADGKTADSGFKAGFIFLHDENSTYDANFINAAKAACDNLGVTAILKTNIPGSGVLRSRCRARRRRLLRHLRRQLRS